MQPLLKRRGLRSAEEEPCHSALLASVEYFPLFAAGEECELDTGQVKEVLHSRLWSSALLPASLAANKVKHGQENDTLAT
jgi:hypothetical protein